MKEKDVSRRNFMALTSLGLTGLFVAPFTRIAEAGMGGDMMGGGMGCGMMGATAVMESPPGALLKDPVDMPLLNGGPGVVEILLEPKPALVNINGTMVNMLTYNGYFHGPTIRAKRGDLLKIRFKNSLPRTGPNALGHQADVTNLHTHGLHVSPSGNSDNPMLHFSPGEEFIYEIDLSKEGGGHLNFYHPHVHGAVSEQFWSGLTGALVLEDENNSPLKGVETHILILKDLSLAGAYPAPHMGHMDYMHGKEGNLVMVNGQTHPVLPIKEGQVQRWQILNASNARFYKLALENHPLYLVGTDGGLLDKPYPVQEILMCPGERVDVLVKADREPKNYRLISLPYSRNSHCSTQAQAFTLMTMSYDGKGGKDDIPPSINPDAKRITADVNSLPRQRLVLSMGRGRGYINGATFGENTCTVNSRVGTYEIWEISNSSFMDHPFHYHANSAQVLSVRGGDPGYGSLYASIPAWKDVVIIPKWGSATLLMSVKDFTGMSMFHCHIIEHEDIGMMGIWNLA
jgi:FtsP/CotA-like multicopper oxidase with cupredoxin domain